MLEDLAESEGKEIGELALAGNAAKEASALALVTNCLRFISVIFHTPRLSVLSKVYLPSHYDENEATIASYYLEQPAIVKTKAATTPLWVR
jgi:hypothetical protein